eukprot:340579_1
MILLRHQPDLNDVDEYFDIPRAQSRCEHALSRAVHEHAHGSGQSGEARLSATTRRENIPKSVHFRLESRLSRVWVANRKERVAPGPTCSWRRVPTPTDCASGWTGCYWRLAHDTSSSVRAQIEY